MKNCIEEGTLQAWFDGELTADAAANLELHMNVCTRCAEAARALEAENSIVSQALAAEFAETVPSERLRQRIDTAIAASHVTSPGTTESAWDNVRAFVFSLRPVVYASAAAIILLAVVLAAVYFKREKPTPFVSQEPLRPVVLPQLKPSPEQSTEGIVAGGGSQRSISRKPMRNRAAVANKDELLARQERQYQKTIAQLNEDMQSKPLRPSLQVEYEHSVALIDNAIAATRDAARKNPKDPQAAQFVLAAYQSKVDLMNLFADARTLER